MRFVSLQIRSVNPQKGFTYANTYSLPLSSVQRNLQISIQHLDHIPHDKINNHPVNPPMATTVSATAETTIINAVLAPVWQGVWAWQIGNQMDRAQTRCKWQSR